MSISEVQKKQTIEDYRRADGDVGSPEVQIALLTVRIGELNSHLKDHPKDHASRRGLLMMVGRRNRLLRYFSRKDRDAYKALIKRLGLRK